MNCRLMWKFSVVTPETFVFILSFDTLLKVKVEFIVTYTVTKET